jgi:SSS family solute:Na+ symporter
VRPLDLAVIIVYLVVIAAIGLKLSGRQRSATDYFVGERQLPWWAVCFSVVATETSTLTVISVPGVAYLGSFSFTELACGYLIGRVLVAVFMLPMYIRGDLVSAYQFLGRRFGPYVQGLASLTFLFTRLLAEGVRLFASSIPIKLLLDELGIHANYFTIILVLTAVTVAYTYVGGIRAVVWTDAIQMALYLGGALLCIGVLLGKVGSSGVSDAWHAGKMQVFKFDWNLHHILTNQYAFITAIVGGAFFAMASHGSDQLIVQRIMACRGLTDARKAMVGSGVFVLIQFTVFSLVGALIWAYERGQSLKQLGLATSDYIYPNFILHDLPAGVSGLLIAGILAATMGSLSSAINTMSNSTVADLIRIFWHRTLDEATMLRTARVLSLVWAAVFVVFASLFSTTKNQVIILGLSITGYTYGAMLGAFMLGLLIKRANQADAVVAFLATIVVMTYVVRYLKIDGLPVAFPWYPPLGVIVTLVVGGLLSLFHTPAAPTPADPPDPQPAEQTAG